jgi:hypothetical protein
MCDHIWELIYVVSVPIEGETYVRTVDKLMNRCTKCRLYHIPQDQTVS